MSEEVFEYRVEFHFQGDIGSKELRSNLSDVSTQLIRDYLEKKRFMSLTNSGVLPYSIFFSSLFMLIVHFVLEIPVFSLLVLVYGIVGLVVGGVLLAVWLGYVVRYRIYFRELDGLKILPVETEDRSDRSELKYKKVKFIMWRE